MTLGTVSPGSLCLCSVQSGVYTGKGEQNILISRVMWVLGKKEKVLRKRCLQWIQTRVHDHTLFTSRESGEHSLVEGSGQLRVCASMYSSLLQTRKMSITLSCNAQLETPLSPCLPFCLSDYAAASKSQIGNTSQGSFRTTAFQRFLFPC